MVSPDNKEDTARAAIQQQKVNIVTSLSNIGFDVATYGSVQNVLNLDFRVTGTNASSKFDREAKMMNVLLIMAQLDQLIAQSEAEPNPQLTDAQNTIQGILSKGMPDDAQMLDINTLSS